MITYGRFERSTCYWGQYSTLTGEKRLIHARYNEIKMWALNRGYKLGPGLIPHPILSEFFHDKVKLMVNSATYARNRARISRVHVAREEKTSA
jgi:hypothetical protein